MYICRLAFFQEITKRFTDNYKVWRSNESYVGSDERSGWRSLMLIESPNSQIQK